MLALSFLLIMTAFSLLIIVVTAVPLLFTLYLSILMVTNFVVLITDNYVASSFHFSFQTIVVYRNCISVIIGRCGTVVVYSYLMKILNIMD
jgi:hypothetical protein